MQINKDKKYFGIYLTCVIMASLLTIGVSVFLILFAIKIDKAYGQVLILPLFALLGDVFAYKSFFGYCKTPDVILTVNDEKVIVCPTKKEYYEINLSDITNIIVKRGLFCRSGKKMLISTRNDIYVLEDICDLYEAYDGLQRLREKTE